MGTRTTVAAGKPCDRWAVDVPPLLRPLAQLLWTAASYEGVPEAERDTWEAVERYLRGQRARRKLEYDVCWRMSRAADVSAQARLELARLRRASKAPPRL